MKLNDRFDTPADVAQVMVASVKQRRPTTIADFAVGGGGLLDAASARWPGATIIGADIDAATVARLRRLRPTWRLTCIDFMDPNARTRSRLGAGPKTSLVLLNPPFSGRGGRPTVKVGAKAFRCSRALAYLIACIPYLDRRGEIVAVLPAGCLTNEQDQIAWQFLNSLFSTTVLSRHDRNTFDDCFVHTVLVHLRRRTSKDRVEIPLRAEPTAVGGPEVRLTRGWVQMFKLRRSAAKSQVRVIHSTALRHGRIALDSSRVARAQGYITGPAVLLPRVGEPSVTKLAMLPPGESVALSDCVIALSTETAVAAGHLYSVLAEKWTAVEAAYGGTCAKFITLAALRTALLSFGYSVSVARKRTDATNAARGPKLTPTAEVAARAG